MITVEWRGPALGGLVKYRFYGTRVPGPCTRTYNVPNSLAHSAGCVQNKHQLAEAHRHWPLASLQSAQSAAGARYTVRGGQLSRPSARPQRAPAMSHGHHTFRLDVDQRLTACRRLRSPGSCLFAFFHRLPTEAWQHPREGAWCMQVRATVMVCDPV